MMNRLQITIAILLLGIQLANGAEDLIYPIADIPDTLKTNAKVVVRYRDQEFRFKSAGKGVITVCYAISILNERGLDNAILKLPYYQKLHRIHSIRGTVFDKAGSKVESLMLDKVVDQSFIAGFSLYDESRIKYFIPRTRTYPFTVEYCYVIELDGILNVPDWDPVEDFNISVEWSKFRIVCPNNLSFRYSEKNLTGKATITKGKTETTTEWNLWNFPALTDEPFCGSPDNFRPVVHVSPDDFELEGFTGNLSTWTGFGKWIERLNQGRNMVPQETVALLQEKVKNCKNDLEKARLIYEYMQNKTRYLNISVGIGGWQTLPAETVDRLGYGDCKALSNYTKSLLEAVGVKSYYCLVNAGPDAKEIDGEFPVNMFNHVILYLPLSTDTLWLECTNQHIPFGFLGEFTDDRKALVIFEDGGKLVHTTIYSADENRTSRSTVITMNENGNAGLTTRATHYGLMYSNKMNLLIANTEDKKRMILNEINIPGTNLIGFDYQEIRSKIPVLKENLDFEIMRYATISGQRILVSVMPIGRQRDIPRKVDERRSDVIIKRSSVTVDSVKIMVPEGFAAESLPAEIKIESQFGNYSVNISKLSDKELLCIRSLSLNKGKYPATSYNQLVEFYKKIAFSDNTKISLKHT